MVGAATRSHTNEFDALTQLSFISIKKRHSSLKQRKKKTVTAPLKNHYLLFLTLYNHVYPHVFHKAGPNIVLILAITTLFWKVIAIFYTIN